MSWTDERVELLRKLWNQGLSASQIAAELSHGITRNAVIGKVHRLGLSGRAKTPSAPSSRPRKVTRAPSHPLTHSAGRTSAAGSYSSASGGGGGGGAVRGNLALAASAATMLSPVVEYDVQPFEDVVVPMSERITIMELRETTCRWPFGDPSSTDFRFCGGNSPVGAPYCAFHSRIAYQPSNDRRRAKPRD
jgi:GcrA cell cycle regulator